MSIKECGIGRSAKDVFSRDRGGVTDRTEGVTINVTRVSTTSNIYVTYILLNSDEDTWIFSGDL
jgi:hypothetical protein